MAEETETPSEPTGGTPSGDATGTQEGAEKFSESDFRARAQRDPAFAWSQVQTHQSRADRADAARKQAEERLSQYQALQPLESRGVDPAVIAGAYSLVEKLNSDPRFRPVIEHYIQHGGELPPGKGNDSVSDSDDDDAEYLSPEERQMRDRLEGLEGRYRDTTVNMARQALTGHLDRFFDRYDFDPDERAQLQKKLDGQIVQWSRMGDSGIKAVERLTTPDGYSAVRAALLGFVDDDSKIGKALERARSRQREPVRRRATDQPSSVSTSGREIPSDLHSRLKGARAALKYAEENPDALEDMGY